MSLKNVAMSQSFASSGLLSFMDTTSVAPFAEPSVGERFRYPRKNIKSRMSALRDSVVCSCSICSFLMSVVRSSTRARIHFCQHAHRSNASVSEMDHSANEAGANPSWGVLQTLKGGAGLEGGLQRAKLKRGLTRPFLVTSRKPCTIAPDR